MPPRPLRADAPGGAGAAAGPAIALYEQLKAHILKRIQDETWPPGHRLPSEHELVGQFGVSRMTAHRALRELADEGRIVRVAGVGSFVAENKPQSTLLQIANVASEIRERGHEHGFRMLVSERIGAPPDVAAFLELRSGESVFHTVCLHLEDGVPVQLEDRYVAPARVPRYLEQDFGAVTPSEYLVRHVPYDEIEHLVDAVLPSAAQARLLQVSPHDACLQLTRRTWTGGQPITLVFCLHPGSRYRLGSRFRTDGHGSVE